MKNQEKYTLLFISLTIIILGFIVYFNSLNGKFIWDDEFLVKNNIYIKNWFKISNIFTESIGIGAGRKGPCYRPLQMISYMVDYLFWHLNVVGYHLTNILLHILVALSIFWLTTILFSRQSLALLTSVLFLVHPIHTESVAYISGRADSLSSLFTILCLIFYIKQGYYKNTTRYILILLSYILALLSKEYSLIVPLFLLLYSFSFKKKILIKEFVSILTIVFIYIILRVVILKLPFFVITTPSTLFQRLPGFFVALTEYSKLLLLPFNLHMEYGNKLLAFYHPKVLVGIIILFSLISYAFKKRKTDNLMFFSIFWFFIGLLPVSNLYPINAYMAEHWLYLPSLGFFLILANGLILIWNNEKIRPVITILIICILLFYSCLTIMQNIYWKEPLNFYNRILKYKPNSFKLYHNLGKTYSDMGYSYAAIKAYSKAIEINSKSSETYNNLGTVYSHMGKLQEAIELYKKALEIDPQYADCYFNLGNAYSAINDTQEAILYYKKAIDIDPQNAHAYAYYNNLASMYALLGDMAKATLFYAKALEINPDFKTARENLNKIR